jgi:hypothetical protein
MPFLIVLLSFFSFFSYSSQPEGLVLKPPADPVPRRILRNKNITFVDEENLNKKVKVQTNDKVLLYETKYRVKGRSRPSRTGSVVAVIDSGEIVEAIKDSEDGRWKAVYFKKKDIKVWVPISALSKKKSINSHQSSSDLDELAEEESPDD